MKTTETIIYDNYLFTLDRYIYESDEVFYFRVNYIYKQMKSNNNLDFDNLVGLSKLEAEKYFNNCEYN